MRVVNTNLDISVNYAMRMNMSQRGRQLPEPLKTLFSGWLFTAQLRFQCVTLAKPHLYEQRNLERKSARRCVREEQVMHWGRRNTPVFVVAVTGHGVWVCDCCRRVSPLDRRVVTRQLEFQTTTII